MKEVIYTAESETRHFGEFLRGIARDFGASRPLAWRLFVRNINSKYRQTIFGFAWALIPPIVAAVVLIYLKSRQILAFEGSDVPYPVFVMSGLILWQTFAEAVGCPLRISSQSANLLAKINFQREALILAGMGEVVLNLLIRLVLLLAVLLWFGVPLQLTALLFPLGLFVLLAFGLMIGLFLLPVGLLYKDVGNGLSFFLLAWLMLSPVFYAPSGELSESLIYAVNPMAPILTTLREMLFTGVFSYPWAFVGISLCALAFLAVSWIFCRLSMPYLIERMTS